MAKLIYAQALSDERQDLPLPRSEDIGCRGRPRLRMTKYSIGHKGTNYTTRCRGTPIIPWKLGSRNFIDHSTAFSIVTEEKPVIG